MRTNGMDYFFHWDKNIIRSKEQFLSRNNTLVTCQNSTMKRMPVDKFRANCSAVLESVQQTNEPVLITRQGSPLVKIVPANHIPAQKFLGRLNGKIKIVGDIESPLWIS